MVFLLREEQHHLSSSLFSFRLVFHRDWSIEGKSLDLQNTCDTCDTWVTPFVLRHMCIWPHALLAETTGRTWRSGRGGRGWHSLRERSTSTAHTLLDGFVIVPWCATTSLFQSRFTTSTSQLFTLGYLRSSPYGTKSVLVGGSLENDSLFTRSLWLEKQRPPVTWAHQNALSCLVKARLPPPSQAIYIYIRYIHLVTFSKIIHEITRINPYKTILQAIPTQGCPQFPAPCPSQI